MPRKTLIKHRRDTKANWKLANPVLDDGEPALETDTNRTKIGTGTTKWNDLQYQNMPFCASFQDFNTQNIAAVDVAYPIKLTTTDFSNGVSVVSNGTDLTRITFAHAGRYNVQWSGQFTNANTAVQDVAVWIRKDGTDVAGSTGHITVPGKHGQISGATIAAWNYILDFTDGQYLEFIWHADSTDVALTKYDSRTYSAGVTPALPSTASVIVTVQQVA